MQILVLKEDFADERRVALVPETVKKLVAAGNRVLVETGAGAKANISDEDFQNAGAEVGSLRSELLAQADILVSIDRPPNGVLDGLRANSTVISLLRPLDEPAAMVGFEERKLTAFSLELIPRSTRAQAMDVLSSMATVAGYKAVLWAAEQIPKMFPMLTTAAGTVPPAKVLVIGAGVAGLQAIATARRLGAVVEGFDIRAAAGEAVRSLGAKFLEMAVDAEGEGGYAKEIGEKEMNQARELIAKSAATTDCIITTAQIPGRPAPRLINRAAVESMRSGSVIVDLAGANGGNCEFTVADRLVQHQGVTIYAPTRLAATIPVHASQLFSRNLFAFLSLLIKEGKLELNLADDILAGSCVVHQGEIVNPRVKDLVARLNQQEVV